MRLPRIRFHEEAAGAAERAGSLDGADVLGTELVTTRCQITSLSPDPFSNALQWDARATLGPATRMFFVLTR